MNGKAVVIREFESFGSTDGGNFHRSSPIPLDGWDFLAVAKLAVVNGVKYIPVVGGVLSALTNAFWPSKKQNVWEQTLQEIKSYIESQNLKVIEGILNGEILTIQGKMEHVADLLEKYPNTKESYDAYVSLARYLDSNQRKFSSFDDETNYQLMPMYAAMILLQATYWRSGIDRRDEIGLTDIDVESLRKLIDDLIGESKSYVKRVYDQAVDRVYSEASPKDVTNYMYSVRGYSLLHGIETVEILECIRKYGVDEGFNIGVVSYSTVVGTVTNRVRTQALTPDSEMEQPLRPKVTPEGVDQISSITGYIGPRINSRPTIGGLLVKFESGNVYRMGESSGESYSIDLNGSKILTVEAWYQGLLEGVRFILDDGRELLIGMGQSGGNYRRFELEGHYVAGFYLDRDEGTYRGRAANFSVSYHID
ncbi:TPA: hypothetical protein L4R02_001353 [Pseudomonas aeruginosa]|nr:hypothetical protein [Pseudomonas aeruginosa]